MTRRTVVLRHQRYGPDIRHLEAYLDDDGNLHVDGHDLGPGTAPVSDDGEYEWFETIAAADLPCLVKLLGGRDGEAVLDLLARCYTGPAASEFTLALYASDIPVKRITW
jgi:hypothetical protein